MKNKLTICLYLIVTTVAAQAQQLTFQGGNVGFNKGSIDQEVLLDLIQLKQEEVKKDVFFNLVVDNFNKNSKKNSPIHNFTTYHYVYNVLDELTAGKSKRAMTQSLLKRSLDFSYVYAFALYSYTMSLSRDTLLSLDLEAAKISGLNAFAKSNVTLKSQTRNNTQVVNPDGVLDASFSEYLDVAFHILIVDQIDGNYEFSVSQDDIEFDNWYRAQSTYLLRKDDLNALYLKMTNDFAAFKTDVDQVEEAFEVFKTIDYDNLERTGVSKDELNAVKQVLTMFSKKVDSKFEGNVVSVIIDMLLENTFYEEAADPSKSYVYLDVQSVISRVYSEFDKIAQSKTAFRYVTPVLDVGVNYAYIGKNSDLTTDNKKEHLYFVSEKIGVRYKIWNWKYTHGQKVGRTYSYYGQRKYWKIQPKRASVSDLHISTYVSGFLYQIQELKSENTVDHFFWGNSIGLTFFNSLVASVGVAVPFTDNSFKGDNLILTAGFDLPITEYIAALSKKKQLK